MTLSLMSEYYDWLCTKINVQAKEHGVECVCSLLYVSPFVAVLREDENLIESALYLRRTFIRPYATVEKREFYRSLGPCSVLEVLVVLLEKMSYQLLGNHLASSDQGALFFELLDNLELSWITDEAFGTDPEGCNDYIEDVISRFIYRDYAFNGSDGGLFPVENPASDLREMGLYQQLDEYLIDRYDLLN